MAGKVRRRHFRLSIQERCIRWTASAGNRPAINQNSTAKIQTVNFQSNSNGWFPFEKDWMMIYVHGTSKW